METVNRSDKVICNGYQGTVVRTKDCADSAWLGNMVEVRLQSGVVCVDKSDLVAA